MGRKKKYENSLIVKDILANECNRLGYMKGSLFFKFLDLKKKDDREFLKREAEYIRNIFNDALKELEK